MGTEGANGARWQRSMQCKIGKAVGEKRQKQAGLMLLVLWPNIAKLKPKPNEGVMFEAVAKEGSCCRSGPLVSL